MYRPDGEFLRGYSASLLTWLAMEGQPMSNIILITTPKGNPKDSEANSVWHIYVALARYAGEHPEMFEDTFYSEFMTQAHKRYTELFNQ